MEKKKILSVQNLTVSVDNKKLLKDINIDLFEGDVLAIDGLNGSGKTTLLRVIFGETVDYSFNSGNIDYCDFPNKNILQLNAKEMLTYRGLIGYVAQEDKYDGLNKVTVEDLVNDSLYASNASQETKEKAFDKFQKFFVNNPKSHINLKSYPGKLSGGEKRLLSLFLGLVCRNTTSLMIIDEPLNNLDFANVMMISDLINEVRLDNPHSAILMVTHCKIITCVNRQRKLIEGMLEVNDSKYVSHHCMGTPDGNLFYLKRG